METKTLKFEEALAIMRKGGFCRTMKDILEIPETYKIDNNKLYFFCRHQKIWIEPDRTIRAVLADWYETTDPEIKEPIKEKKKVWHDFEVEKPEQGGYYLVRNKQTDIITPNIAFYTRINDHFRINDLIFDKEAIEWAEIPEDEV